MANTTYETGTWETYGKWTLVALILMLFIVALIAAVWGWEQGYFDTVVPTRPRPNRASTVVPAPSLNFSSYRSTLNAQMRATGTPPAYTPHHLEHGSTPQPTYRTHTSTTEIAAQKMCPLPVTASPNPYTSPVPETIELTDLPQPEVAATSPWKTINGDTGATTRRTLEPIVNQEPSRVSTKKSERGSVRGPQTPTTAGTAPSRSLKTKAPSTPKTHASTPMRSTGPSSLRSATASVNSLKQSSSTNRSGNSAADSCTHSARMPASSSSSLSSGSTRKSIGHSDHVSTPLGALDGHPGNTPCASKCPGSNSSNRSRAPSTISQLSARSTDPKDIV